MTDHCIDVRELVGGDLDHFVIVVPQPTADIPVFLCRRRIPVQVSAQSVEVDAHGVVLAAIDHIGRGGAQHAAEANLFTAYPLAEPGSEQQVA